MKRTNESTSDRLQRILNRHSHKPAVLLFRALNRAYPNGFGSGEFTAASK